MGTFHRSDWPTSTSRFAVAVLLGLAFTGCARYHPEPISAARKLEDFEARSLASPELGTFMADKGEAASWPQAAWNLRDLTLVAFFYSPALDVARARWGVSQGAVVSAGASPNPAANVALGYNATTDKTEVTPWIRDAALDLPVEVAGKRGIRIAEARQRSEAARLDLVTAAWNVRARVRNAYLDFYLARQTDSLLARRLEFQEATVGILEGWQAVGEASPTDVTRARVDLANTRVAAVEAIGRRAAARSELADALGVPPSALDGAKLTFSDLDRVSLTIPEPEVRRRALVNRSDVLGALAEYEASQKALQLEIRKQYPDISLGPAYQLDQTDVKWSLGLGLILPLFDRNKGPIAEAEARRRESAALFVALQSRVLGEVEGAVAAARGAVAQVAAADTLLAALGRQEQASAQAYRVGEISRLELLGLQSETAATALARLQALAQAQRALGTLEDAMQAPLDPMPWVAETPQRSPAREESNR